MSPEQRAGMEAGPASDIFALGCVLRAMVAQGAPRSLAHVIARATAARPEDRWPSAQMMADALQRCGGHQTAGRRLMSRVTRAAAAMAFAVLLTALGRSLLLGRGAATPVHVQQLVSTAGGSHRSPSLSPDGGRIAFVAAAEGTNQIWVRSLDALAARQLTFGEMSASRPRWSPQGDRIVFARQVRGEPPSIWNVAAEGGAPTRLIDNARNPGWSWDGDSLVFEREFAIWIANAAGSNQRPLDGIPPDDVQLSPRYPTFSPDGSQIAFFRAMPGAPMGDIWVIPAAGGTARPVTADSAFGGAPSWTPDGRFIVFPSARAGSTTLWKVAATGGEPEPVLVSPGEDTEPEVARDGRSLVYTSTRNHYAIVITDPASGTIRSVRESRSALVAPSFSPQGHKLLYFEVPTRVGQLFTMNTDGTDVTQLSFGGDHSALPHWSADGSDVYYYRDELGTGRHSFRRLRTDGSGASVALVSDWSWATHNGARVDPAGRKIIYSRLERRAPVETNIRDVLTGRESPFPRRLLWPRWSGDGSLVLGVSVGDTPPVGDVAVCRADGSRCQTLARNGYAAQWSSDGLRIYFLRRAGSAPEVWSVSRNGTDENKVAVLPGFHDINMYDVGPDGRIVWVQFRRGTSELWRLSLEPER
jgi:Tol biopolymer transport system component